MKKAALFLLLASMMLSAVACNSNPGDTTTPTTTPEATTTVTTQQTPTVTPGGIKHDVKLNADLETLKTTIEASTPTVEEFDGYTMKTSGAEWKINSGIDYSLYNFMGSGSDLVSYVQKDDGPYGKYDDRDIVYYRVNYEIEDEPIKKSNRNTANGTKALGAKIVENKKLGKLLVYYQAIDLRMSVDYSEVTGGTGSFLRISFHTNLPATYKVNISSTKNDTGDGIIVCKNVVPAKSEDGSYVGWGKMTIPYGAKGTYHINFVCGSKCLATVPITINEVADPRNPEFHLQYTGDWDSITAAGYWDSLTNLFYNTYPRLYARWAKGGEPKIITFTADPTYDGVAYAMGTQVVVSSAYANANPSDIGFFSHEITHSVQQFNFYYGDGAWFTENMANFGGFRYHHWSNSKYIQLYQDANQNDLYNWNWGAYGDGSKWFFTYLDSKWPTTLDENGNKVRGLLDTLVYEIKGGKLTDGTDNPTDVNTPFNKIVKEITGFDCIEDVRKQYEKDFKSGAWDFKGFGDYVDNFLTENIPYVENPDYPMITEKNPGDITATKLDTPVTEGNNIALGSSVHLISGAVKAAEDGSKLVDGNLGTKWCSNGSSTKDRTYGLDGTSQWIVLDLGMEKAFNTYTIYNTRTKESYNNMTEWEILISMDAKNWTSVDYQPSCNDNIVSFNVGDQSARYILIKGYKVDGSSSGGTIRLYEFQLYNVE
ncbi:MAG: discoidin domain-containing protein [Clostridia bacterium]|nr:discoidin domain-containing protein [Clostridia bacterium]